MPDDTPSYRAEPDGEFANRLERELLQRLAAPATAPADPADGTLAILEVSDDDWPPNNTPFVDGAPEPELDPRTTRHRWLVVVAAAAVVVLAAAAALAYGSRRDTTGTVSTDVTTTSPPTPVTTDPAAHVAVAEAFMEAWVAGDSDAVVALIGDPITHEDSGYVEPGHPLNQVNIASVEFPGVVPALPAFGDVAAIPALHDWFRAVGWELRPEPCFPVTSIPEGPDSVNVVCNYTYENDLTRAVDRAPVNERFELMVVGDEISTIHGGMFNLDADIWQLFSDWIRSEHPDDFAAMYSTTNPPAPRVDEASIALWERHVDEFVNSPAVHAPPSVEAPTRAQFGAQARMICAAAAFESWTPMWWGTPEGLVRASQTAMEYLRAMPRPEDDPGRTDQLFSLLEEINRMVVADTWFHNDTFYGLQGEKDALGGFDFWGCPVGPLGG